MLDLTQLKKLADKAYNGNTVTRERGADDLVFYWKFLVFVIYKCLY